MSVHIFNINISFIVLCDLYTTKSCLVYFYTKKGDLIERLSQTSYKIVYGTCDLHSLLLPNRTGINQVMLSLPSLP